MTERDPHPRLGVASSIAALATVIVFAVVDVASSAPHAKAGAMPATLGFILLSASVLVGGTALALQAAILVGCRIPRATSRALGAAVITWYPARWLAAVITSGSGISRSGWAGSMRIAVIVTLLLAAACAAALLPIAYERLSRRSRIAIGSVIAAGGITALVLTSFYPITYVRAYRGILVVSAMLLQLGVALAVSARSRPVTRLRPRVAAAVLAGVAVMGIVLSRVGGAQRAYASYTIFAHTIVAQKLQPMLLRVSPVFHATSRVDLGETRLAEHNRVPVPPLERGRYRGNNVVFVTFDALRSDIVMQAVSGHPVAPNLQALAREAVSFRNAIATYSHTSRSILSVLAASWRVSFPSETHASTDPADVRARTRLPRLLGAAGYESVAIMMAGRWGEVFFDKERFPAFDRHVAPGDRCEAQVAAFQRYLADRNEARPFWAWVHMFDTHTPLVSDREDELFGTSASGRYAAAVHHADRCLGEMLATLAHAGVASNTIVVVSADHGEALGEHGRTLQHSTCYWHDIHVPLLIRLPDRAARMSIDVPIQPTDLLPTLGNLLGIAIDEPGTDGDDLSGLLDADASAARSQGPAEMAFSQGHAEQYRCASVVSGPWHLIYTEAAQSYELYDIDVDPREERNLAADRPDVVDTLRPVLDTFREHAATGRP